MHVWSKLSAAKWEDAWEERFHGPLQTGLVINYLPGGKTIRIELYSETKRELLKVQKEFGGSIREVKNQNWQAKAAASLQPIKIKNRLIVTHDPATAAAMQAEYPQRIVLCIPGEMAFGTGDHATTSTCLRLITEFAATRTGATWSVLDLGCGTGILAIAARQLGASHAAGFDYDPAAVRVANKNVKQNTIRGLKFTSDDVTTWKPDRRYDLVCANIFYDVLTLSFKNIAAALAPGGILIVSGIMHTQADSCLAAGRKAGLIFDKPIRKGKWVTAVGRHPAK